MFVEEGLRELGLEPPDSQANFSWIALGDRDEARGDPRRSASAGVVVRGGEGLGGPGHIRVTYGTRAENERFLAALGEPRLSASTRSAQFAQIRPRRGTNFVNEPREHAGFLGRPTGAAPACPVASACRLIATVLAI